MKYDLLDIANYQDVYDLAAVYTETECVYHHAVESNWTNPYFTPRRDQARTLGKPFGAYLFLQPGDVAAQVSLFKLVVGGLSANDPRPMLDVEAHGVTAADVLYAMEELASWTGALPLLYGGMNLLCGLAKEQPRLTDAPLWFAWYPDDVNAVQTILARFSRLRLGGFSTDPWDHPTIWQYSSAGNVAGINNRVDVNKYWKGISLSDILITQPQRGNEMPSVVPDWIPVEDGNTSHYRVVDSLQGALFQAKGKCQVTEAQPDDAGVTSIPLGVTIHEVTGMSMADNGRRVVVTGYNWNTWDFHTNGQNPDPVVAVPDVTDTVKAVLSQARLTV